MRIGDSAVIDVNGLDALIATLLDAGYDTRGPVVRDGAIMPGPISGISDLPAGYHDEQAPGHYRLSQSGDRSLFAWAVGPGSWKAELFPPTQELWRATVSEDGVTFTEPDIESAPMAIIGARPCEVAALGILDRVLEPWIRGSIRATRPGVPGHSSSPLSAVRRQPPASAPPWALALEPNRGSTWR